MHVNFDFYESGRDCIYYYIYVGVFERFCVYVEKLSGLCPCLLAWQSVKCGLDISLHKQSCCWQPAHHVANYSSTKLYIYIYNAHQVRCNLKMQSLFTILRYKYHLQLSLSNFCIFTFKVYIVYFFKIFKILEDKCSFVYSSFIKSYVNSFMHSVYSNPGNASFNFQIWKSYFSLKVCKVKNGEIREIFILIFSYFQFVYF